MLSALHTVTGGNAPDAATRWIGRSQSRPSLRRSKSREHSGGETEALLGGRNGCLEPSLRFPLLRGPLVYIFRHGCTVAARNLYRAGISAFGHCGHALYRLKFRNQIGRASCREGREKCEERVWCSRGREV